MSPRDREPLRTCVGCRGQRPKSELIRIARGPGGEACFDVDGRLPGRGAWVCPAAACLDRLSAGALGHVLRAPVALPPAAARRALLAAALARRVGNLLSVARKAGAASLGPAAARAALAAGRAGLVLTAADLAPDAAAAWAERAGPVPLRCAPGAREFGELLGTRPLEVAAIAPGGLAAAVLAAIDRWQTFVADSCNNEKSGTQGKARQARDGAATGGG